ncbi:MAG: hypothetical protein ABJE95_38255 [Byssovorax sp.]
MRSPLFLGPALVAGLTLTLSTPARADLARPPGFVESCTMKSQSGAGKECLSCAAFYGNSSHCEESLASYGFKEGCRTSGASVWSEVWCRPAGPRATPVPNDVLAQLDKSTGHPPAPASAAPTGTLPTDPVDPAFVAPPAVATAEPTAMPTAAPPSADPPAPPPLPPSGGCGGCATPRPETAIWAPLLALGALAVGWSRRRNRR